MSLVENEQRVVFTKEMKKDYTILIPTMLPMHFELIAKIIDSYGYKTQVLNNSGNKVKECGLKYVHNDSCYPAILVIGQFIDALESGEYDPHKTALMITQTGGGCRASNYIALLRKALERAGFGYVPVISLNFAGLESNPGFTVPLSMAHRMFYAVNYGDLLMLLLNQCKPYEITKGESEKLAHEWVAKLAKEMETSSRIIDYKKVKENYAKIIADFARIPRRKEQKVKVGIVGEIFVKFSPLGNNNLEDFLISEGAETVMPGLLDFCLYCVYNGIVDEQLYGTGKLKALGSKVLFKGLIKKQHDIIDAINLEGSFEPPASFSKTCTLTEGYMGLGAKMGEGWLLTAEMLELIEQGTTNIVCAQPFGCLPNHIVGKGVMKLIKEKNPDVNIVAIDYDPGATQINQENRIKLMLANAKQPVAPQQGEQKNEKEQESEKELATQAV
jgi:predicted nucleotide-binding protein (sugar kinase/HSP70/actin superfamily)